MKKENPIQEVYYVDFVSILRGTDKNLKKCIQIILDHFKKNGQVYEVGFCKRMGWREFPSAFILKNNDKFFNCFFYKDKEDPHTKLELDQGFDKEEDYLEAEHKFVYLTFNEGE